MAKSAKEANINIRCTPQDKALAEAVADADARSVASLVVMLIRQEAIRRGISLPSPTKKKPGA